MVLLTSMDSLAIGSLFVLFRWTTFDSRSSHNEKMERI